MSSATLTIRAHFDGRFIIPDEPVDLPVDAPLNVNVRAVELPSSGDGEIPRKLAALERFAKKGVSGVTIPDEMLRREHLYDTEGR